ncbi:MAG: hypothetical protein H6R17_1684 [Proteobacteria bacterium]|nr:hypothetical protein [Pseudomonadota bacterium]
MNFAIFTLRSIKARVTLFTLAIFLISTLALAVYGRGILHQAIQGMIGEQQLSTAASIAAGIDQELRDRRSEIEAVAATLTPALLTDAALRARLERRPSWPVLFNEGAFIVGADGVATVAIPSSSARIGARFSDWAFVANALNDGATSLGQPAGSAPSPVVGLATPLRDKQGKVIGALIGVSDVNRSGFLQRFTQSTDSKAGNYLLISTRQRRVIAGSDRNGITETLAAPGTSPLIEQFLTGHEGFGAAFNARGDELLAAAKAIPMTDWQVLIALPKEDALAPLRAARKLMALATIVLGLLASGVIWLILRRELTPMLTTVRTLAKLSASNQRPQLLDIPGQGEIAELIAGFNRLLATLALRENALLVAEAELRIAAAAFESHEGMVVTDARGIILRVNKAFTESTGYTAEEAMGQKPNLLKSGRHDKEFYRQMWETLNRTGGWQGEIWDRRKNGEIFPKWLTISAVKDKEGAVSHYVGAHFDITERKRKERQIHLLAFYDPLTTLPNRRLFSDRLNQTMAAGRRNACHGALMFLDLDNFKSLNDTHGHIAGDLLLVEAAHRLRNCVREIDTVARFGGDEFVVLLSELNADETESAALTRIVAEKIRAALSATYRLTLKHEGLADTIVDHRCSASIGVAMLINDGASPDDLLKWADAAMYQAKAAGRNSIHFHGTDAPG